jgi:hypothetical protein
MLTSIASFTEYSLDQTYPGLDTLPVTTNTGSDDSHRDKLFVLHHLSSCEGAQRFQ